MGWPRMSEGQEGNQIGQGEDRRLFPVSCISISFLEYRMPFWLTTMLAGFGLGVLGCASPRMEPLPPPTRETFRFSTNYEGLEIAADPYFDAERAKKFFGADLLSHEIVPVRISFRNTRPEGAYLLQPESVAMLEAKGVRTTAANSDVSPDHSRSLDWYGNVILPASLLSPLALVPILPLGFALDESRRDAIDVAKHMESVGFQDRPLYPSDSNSGFLYFRLSGTKDLERVSGLRFEIRNLRSREVIPVFVTIKDKPN